MDSLQTETASGGQLLDLIVALTGLPNEMILAEIEPILAEMGCSRDQLTMDDMRQALAIYLQTFQSQLLES